MESYANNFKAYRKSDTSGDYVPNKADKKKQKNVKSQEKSKSEERGAQSRSVKGKPNFVPLFSPDGVAKTAVYLPGRHSCQCLASRHKLIGNCIKCGRIVCQQEGSGPCMTCGSLVCTRDEKALIQAGEKAGDALYKKLMNIEGSGNDKKSGLKAAAKLLLSEPTDGRVQEGLKKAMEHKNQLLEFDRTSERRTQVIDDESDYFNVSGNQWLSENEREVLKTRGEELREKRHGSRLARKITLDFAGRQVINEDDTVDMSDMNDPVVQAVYYQKYLDGDYQENDRSVNFPAPTYEETENWPIVNSSAVTSSSDIRGNRMMRIQDRELQEMSDEGWCLTVHQPYASLIIYGLKKHEGRSWYSPHRGRLWIASAGKTPTSQEIRDAEKYACIMTGKENVVFPEQYPTGCLLGCVDVVNCLPQEDYQKQYPNGDSGAPYVFICENPQQLIAKFPVQGKPKLYKLDARIQQAAQKTIRRQRDGT